MRISGGSLAGRNVKVPPGIIRPSMDRMRESVFAALGDLSGLSFLDLFSGSGVVALEAASRGAAHIEAVEADKGKAKTMLSNVSISPVQIQCRFISAELYIKRAKRNFDIIFCDPPFSYQYKSELINSIGNSPLVKQNIQSKNIAESMFIILHRPKNEIIKISSETTGLSLDTTRYYGNSAVDFFKKIS
jgi:16S rRNA (guanine(966)-N(2))-methyltransferase RsmD